MSKYYIVFVVPEHLDEDEMGYSGVVEWVYRNFSSENVLVLEISDVYLLQYNSKVLDIINEANNSMLQVGEDDWVISHEAKLKIHNGLTAYYPQIKEMRLQKITSEIIRLLNISINTNKYLYFIF